MILRDHRQRQINAGGDARRGPDVAVAHEDLVRLELDLRVARNEMAGALPVRGSALAVEQPGFGEDVGAGADAGDADAALCHAADESERAGATRRLSHALAARDDQGRDRTQRPRAACEHLDTGGTPHWPGLDRHRPDRGRAAREAMGDLEGRDGTRRIEQLEVRKDQNADHGESCAVS
jgi:hypothetical protein